MAETAVELLSIDAIHLFMAETVLLFGRLGRKSLLDGLDGKLFEGLPQTVQTQDVIELYGEEGSGKTQILMHFIANCILPRTWGGKALGGRGVGVIFVDTDYHFSMIRLVEIVEEQITSRFSKLKLPMMSVAACQTFIKSCLSRLILAKCNSTEELLATIESFNNILCNRSDICVMMIDSVSAFYWQDKSYGGESYCEQHQRKLVDLLKRYINTYHLVIMATKPAIYSKDAKHWGKQTISKDHFEYMVRKWQEFVKYRYVVSRTSDSTFLLKKIKPSAGNCVVVQFIIDKGGLIFY